MPLHSIPCASNSYFGPLTPNGADRTSQSLARCGEMMGAAPCMKRLFSQVKRLASHDAPVLISGETGSGKDLVAKALHTQSFRKRGPLEIVNCGAISQSLALSELFGHERGAFTGAHDRRPGALERADHGTLFLDEIAELSLEVQASLLRALESGEFRRLGGTTTQQSSFRLICASHKDLCKEVKAGRFRQDLFYRIGVVLIHVPPLKERPEDIALLAELFLSRSGDGPSHGPKEPPVLTRPALEKLMAHPWPGNVRELRNVLSRAEVGAQEGQIHPAAIQFGMTPHDPWSHQGVAEGAGASPYSRMRSPHSDDKAPLPSLSIPIGGRTMDDIRWEVIRFELIRQEGNLSATARILEIPKQTLHDYCKKRSLLGHDRSNRLTSTFQDCYS